MKLKSNKTGAIWTMDADGISNSSDGTELSIFIKDQDGRHWVKSLEEIMKDFTVYKEAR